MGTDGKSNGAGNGSIRLPEAGSTKGAVNFPNSRKVHAEGRGGRRGAGAGGAAGVAGGGEAGRAPAGRKASKSWGGASRGLPRAWDGLPWPDSYAPSATTGPRPPRFP